MKSKYITYLNSLITEGHFIFNTPHEFIKKHFSVRMTTSSDTEKIIILVVP